MKYLILGPLLACVLAGQALAIPIETTIVGRLENSTGYLGALAGTFIYDNDNSIVTNVEIDIFNGSSVLQLRDGTARTTANAVRFHFVQPLANQYGTSLLHVGIQNPRGTPLDSAYKLSGASGPGLAATAIETCLSLDCTQFDSVTGTGISAASGFVSSTPKRVSVIEEQGKFILASSSENPDIVALENLKRGYSDTAQTAKLGDEIQTALPLSDANVDQIDLSVSDRTIDLLGTLQSIYSTLSSAAGSVAEAIKIGIKTNLKGAELIFTELSQDPPRDDFQELDFFSGDEFKANLADSYGTEFSILDDAFSKFSTGIEAYEMFLLALERAQGASAANEERWLLAQLTSAEVFLSLADQSLEEAKNLFGNAAFSINSLDPLTLGLLQNMSMTSNDFRALTIINNSVDNQGPVTSVPEPSSIMLMLTGLIFLGVYRRTNSQKITWKKGF